MVVSISTSAQSWETVIENKTFDSGLLIENKSNVLIKDCFVSNRNGVYGIKLINCQNVRINNTKVHSVGNEESNSLNNLKGSKEYVFAFGNAIGIYLLDCNKVIVEKSEVLDVFGQGIKIFGADNIKTSDIILDGNRIAYIYDDAVKFEVKGDQNDNSPESANNPFKGGIIRNNIIHDIGLGVVRLPFARHGMYLKAADILVEGNTIYNCFYGSGISLRNAGIIRNNKIWNCAYACIAYHAQTKTSESSKTVIIENNDCRQEYAMDFPMRHISNPSKSFNACVMGCIMLGIDGKMPKSSLFIEKFIVLNNKCSIYKDFPSELDKRTMVNDKPVNSGKRQIAMITINGKNDATKLSITGNTLIDERVEKIYFNDFKTIATDTIGNILK